jgi:hypothetical protein
MLRYRFAKKKQSKSNSLLFFRPMTNGLSLGLKGLELHFDEVLRRRVQTEMKGYKRHAP